MLPHDRGARKEKYFLNLGAASMKEVYKSPALIDEIIGELVRLKGRSLVEGIFRESVDKDGSYTIELASKTVNVFKITLMKDSKIYFNLRIPVRQINVQCMRYDKEKFLKLLPEIIIYLGFLFVPIAPNLPKCPPVLD